MVSLFPGASSVIHRQCSCVLTVDAQGHIERHKFCTGAVPRVGYRTVLVANVPPSLEDLQRNWYNTSSEMPVLRRQECGQRWRLLATWVFHDRHKMVAECVPCRNEYNVLSHSGRCGFLRLTFLGNVTRNVPFARCPQFTLLRFHLVHG